MTSYRGVGRRGYLVVHGNVALVHIVDVDAVAFLPQGRMLLNLVNIALAIAHEPVVADINLAANDDRARAAAAYRNVAGAGLNIEIYRAANRQRPLKRALRCGSESRRGCEQHGQRDGRG